MKKNLTIFLIVFTIHYSPFTFSQDISPAREQQLENKADADQGETKDDAWLQDLDHFRKDPLNINIADAEELKQLHILTDLQIEGLISYRHLMGRLISIYELQAVPGWNISTIKKISAFIKVTSPVSFADALGQRFRHGEHSLLLRTSQVLERSIGFDRSDSGNKYLGSPQRILFRYGYNYKNVLQFGWLGDKDAGEQFLKGGQNKGFDFYSFHFFARKIGIIQSLAIGDFTVNMGQGLIEWQSLAFKKSVEVMAVKRQSALLRPYSSSGEFNFHRGIGLTIKKGKIESTAFLSLRKLSANFVADSLQQETFISSFLTSGYHRTVSEMADRNNLAQTAFGGTLLYRETRWHAAINGIYYRFSLPVQKRNEPYNLYAISGKKWYNISVDYSYTYKNMHLFGEAAADKNLNKAFINGLLVSVDPKVDLSLVQRTIPAIYQSIGGDAFTENIYPTNETGFYAGITIRPSANWQLDAYADLYKFPWLRYRVDAPSHGTDFLLQATYTPNKQVEIYSRFRNESKQSNRSTDQANQPGTHIMNDLVFLPRQDWRTQVSYMINRSITLRNRVELLWYDHRGPNKENGFLIFSDLIYKPLLKPYSGTVRLEYFETGGYNSRVYAYENDVLYSYSIPASYNKGFRYYFNLNYDLNKKLSVWLRLAQTVNRDKMPIGSGLDEVPGGRKTELKLQLGWTL